MSFVRWRTGVQGLALAAAILASYPALVTAQTTSASVSGSVQDSQGGVLPGVTVTLTSRTQGNVLTAVTDNGGRFVFSVNVPEPSWARVAWRSLLGAVVRGPHGELRSSWG